MHNGYYPLTHLFPLMDNMLTSGGSVAQLDLGVVTDPMTLGTERSRPQESNPAEDDNWKDTWPSDFLNPQVNGEVSLRVSHLLLCYIG
jgi:hypothetical protein